MMFDLDELKESSGLSAPGRDELMVELHLLQVLEAGAPRVDHCERGIGCGG